MADTDFNFKINPADYLGSDYEAFKTDMLELAISSPKDYFALRKIVLKRVKTQAVQDQYNIYYSLLTAGVAYNEIKEGGTATVAAGKNISGLDGGNFIPKMPKQLVNEFALKAAKTIEATADEAVEMLLPMNYRKIAEGREISKTASNLGFD